LGLVLALATCRDALGPGTVTRARIAVAPVLPSRAALAEFGLTIDRVRFVVVRPASDTLADTTLALPPNATELALDIRVPLVASPDTLSVSVLALSGTIPLFTGTRLVHVPTALPPPQIPVDTYIGPAADSIVILQRNPFILVNDSLRFQVQGFNAGTPVTQFFVAWSTGDTTVARINGFGVLRAPTGRAAVRVRARTPSGATDSVTATFILPAVQLVALTGSGQTDTVGSPLATPLEVQARASDGLGVGGVAVRFRALTGGGTVTDSLVVTDSGGRARTTVTLGGLLGGQSFEASAAGLSPVTFSATALAGPPTQLLAAAGDAQVAVVNTAVPTRPRVQLKDAGGNPVANATVTFAVDSGGGAVTGSIDTTDATGMATVGDWTLGTLAGTNKLKASAAGLTRTFSATGVAGAPSQLTRIAGDSQSAPVGAAVATDPAVRAVDQYGNSVAGVSVTFSVSGGGGGVTGAAQLTNAAGVATVGGWTLGTAVGANTLTANMSGVTPVSFTATGVAGAATTILKIAGDSQAGVVNTALASAPRVKLVDQFGNPVAGAGVTFAVTAGGGLVGGASQTTDTGGVATAGSWTLGTATGPNGLNATTGSLLATFNATALAGAPTQIAQVAGFVPTAVVGTPVPVRPAVLVRDQFNNPVVGVPVTFVDSGGGSVTGGSATTDTTGVARVGSWRLDTLAGANTLTASSGILSTNFSATGLAGLATQIVKATADSLTAVVGTFVGIAPTVRARDQYGNAVSGLSVTFAVTGGAGSVTGATPTTDTSGLATVGSWALDTLVGANALTASAGALSPAVFTASGVPAAPSRLVKLLGDGQTGVVNAALPVAPTVRLTDRYGNAIAGDTIDFFIFTDGGFVATPTVETDAGGTATSGLWTLANFVAQNRLHATLRGIAGVPPAQFTAAGTPDVPFRLLLVSSDTQTAIAGQQVNLPPAVEVADTFFNPVPGVFVKFALTGSLLGGSVTPDSAATDSAGVARVSIWTLDPIAGLNTLDASVPGLLGSPITFSANGVTTTATTIALDNGNSQLGVVNALLPTAYTVLVTDGVSPVQNVQVHWAVGPAGGFINPSTSLTNVNGIATATRRLGIGVGTQTATASVGGLINSPVTFTATALADTAFQILKLGGDRQTVRINALVPVRPSVRVTDTFGNPIAGIPVSFTPDALGGIVTGGAQVTDTGGVAIVGTWTLGGVVGTQSLTVSAGSLTPIAFTAIATASAPASLSIVQGNLQTATVNTVVPVRPAVVVRDASGNPVPGVQVTFTAGSGNGSVVGGSPASDSAGVATVGSWTLDRIVGADTLIASAAGVPSIAFTATGVADVVTRLLKQAGDLQTATVNTAVLTRPTARVTDQYGNPVAGRSVTWVVASGGGTPSTPVPVPTDAVGISRSPVWTLGTAVGTNTLTATATGLIGSPVTFTATGAAGAAKQMVIKDGNNQSAVVDALLGIPPSVVVRDTFNNVVPGVIVTFNVVLGGGSATGTTGITDSNGLAAVGSWRLGQITGTNTLRASAAGVQPVTFTASGVAGPPVKLGFLLDPPHSLAGNTIEPAVAVAIQDQFGNTVIPASDIVRLDFGRIASPGAKLLGTTDVAAVNGVAVFPDLAIDSAGVGYTLFATGQNRTGIESKPFDVGGVIAAFTDDRLHPVAAAFNLANGFVYVPGGDQETRTLGVLDPGKGLLTLFPILQTQPFGVAVNAQTNRVYVTTFALLTGAVVVIDGRNDLPIGLIPLPDSARGIAIDELTDRAFVAVAGDPSKGEPPALAIIDGKDNRVVATIPFPEGALTGIGVTFNPNDRLVYVAIPNVGVGIFDPEQFKFVGAISIVGEKGAVGTYGVAVDVRTNLLFATNRAENTVSVIDPVSRTEVNGGRFRVGLSPEGLGVDADRGAVYVGNSGDGTVSFIDAGKLSVFATLIVGPTPKAAAVNPATGRFYVPTFTDDRVRVVQP
jgi:adhesin/invasin